MEIDVHLPKPHQKQRAFLESRAKRKVIVAGRRGGKTTGTHIDAAEKLLAGRRILQAAPTADQTDKFWELCKLALGPLIDAKYVYKNETRRILEFRSPDLCLIDRNQGNMVNELTARQGTWSLLYRDELAELWGRSSKYDSPDSLDYLPPEHRSISDEPQTGLVAWPAFPINTQMSLTRNGQTIRADNRPRKS